MGRTNPQSYCGVNARRPQSANDHRDGGGVNILGYLTELLRLIHLHEDIDVKLFRGLLAIISSSRVDTFPYEGAA